MGASGSRTAVNDAWARAARSPGCSPRGRSLLVLLFLTAPIADLPKAVLGAVIVSAAIGLVDPPAWRALWRTTGSSRDRRRHHRRRGRRRRARGDRFAVGLSIVDVVRRSARPHDAVLGWVARLGRWGRRAAPARRSRPASWSTVSTTVCSSPTPATSRAGCARRSAARRPHRLVLDAEAITHVDTAGLGRSKTWPARSSDDGIALHFARAKHPIAERITERVTGARFHGTVRAAVHAAVRDQAESA